ncbi:MAG: HlyD family efflux transporter periplasmic adaptor subunit [Planctomycetes bacterium]|nr:HlyD family efflux transporter periplasmic adaptor subunit [Planctomycetota bacterium]
MSCSPSPDSPRPCLEKVDPQHRIELSEQAQQNIGLATINLEPATFSRTITVPGIVCEKPGHSDVEVTAPLTGVVTQVYPLRGETLDPGDPLFRMRLTHEEIVQAQADLLKTTEELDVVGREIKRLERITEGVVPGRTKVEREYEKQKLEAVQRAQMQALVLHGLTEDQVQSILKDRRLLKEVLIYATGGAENGERSAEGDAQDKHNEERKAESSEPSGLERAVLEKATQTQSDPGSGAAGRNPRQARHSDLTPPRPRRFFELESLVVDQGQHVEVGKPLCKLGDHSSLYIEGRAFEREAQLLTNAVAQGWPVVAVFETGTDKPETVRDLHIVYLSNAVDKESRAFPFYVELPNEIARDARTSEGHRFLSWKYKPGQRVQLLVPVEQWPNRLVVPAEAVVQDGAEIYVFQRNGDLFERRTVHVEYQDQRSAVLANDGSVYAGEHIVVTGAFQLHLAIKNKAGGGIDPHAGHQH